MINRSSSKLFPGWMQRIMFSGGFLPTESELELSQAVIPQTGARIQSKIVSGVSPGGSGLSMSENVGDL